MAAQIRPADFAPDCAKQSNATHVAIPHFRSQPVASRRSWEITQCLASLISSCDGRAGVHSKSVDRQRWPGTRVKLTSCFIRSGAPSLFGLGLQGQNTMSRAPSPALVAACLPHTAGGQAGRQRHPGQDPNKLPDPVPKTLAGWLSRFSLAGCEHPICRAFVFSCPGPHTDQSAPWT
jgi:hypothetical protein